MNRKERQEARANRYRELAEKANKQSNEASKLSRSMVEHIPLGQPILVGHHSERAHRSLLDRSWNTLGKSVKLSEKAEYFVSDEMTQIGLCALQDEHDHFFRDFEGNKEIRWNNDAKAFVFAEDMPSKFD